MFCIQELCCLAQKCVFKYNNAKNNVNISFTKHIELVFSSKLFSGGGFSKWPLLTATLLHDKSLTL